MTIQRIDGEFAVCRVEDFSQVDVGAPCCFTGATDEENSLVCLEKNVPANTTHMDGGWQAFRIQGVLDFSLIGILADISRVLAAEKIGIFVVSTYNTDYVLTKKDNYTRALNALARAGYTIE